MSHGPFSHFLQGTSATFLEVLLNFCRRNGAVGLLLCHAAFSGQHRGSHPHIDYGHWAVLCILVNFLKYVSTCASVDR